MPEPDQDEISKIEPVRKNDPWLTVAAQLVASDGEVLGKAVILSPSIAVTTAKVAISARDKATLVQKSSAANSRAAISAPMLGGGPQ